MSEIVRNAPCPLRVVGSGHSFSPLVPTAGSIIKLDQGAGIIVHDPATSMARINAGTALGPLARELDGIGQALPNMGDIDEQTVGGALGTGTHGTGPTLGAYHTQLLGLVLVDGRGDIRQYDKTSGMIEALGVSLGLFGITTEVTFQNMPSYRLHKRRRTIPIKDMLDQFDALMGGHRSAEFYYIPLSDTALFLASDMTEEPATTRPPENDEEGLATLALLRNWLSWFPFARRKLISGAISKVPAEDFVETWFKVYVSERKTRFNEMEYHLPVKEGPRALAEIIKITERDFPDVYFPMEVRTVAADEFWLSPFYRRPTCSIAVHHDSSRNPLAYHRACEAVFLKHGGRPHWGKMHNLMAPELKALYPRWEDAMAVRRELDPDNRFVTPYLAHLIGSNA